MGNYYQIMVVKSDKENKFWIIKHNINKSTVTKSHIPTNALIYTTILV